MNCFGIELFSGNAKETGKKSYRPCFLGVTAMVYHLRGYSLLQILEIARKEEECDDITSFLPDF
jgi:hypothetical protein